MAEPTVKLHQQREVVVADVAAVAEPGAVPVAPSSRQPVGPFHVPQVVQLQGGLHAVGHVAQQLLQQPSVTVLRALSQRLEQGGGAHHPELHRAGYQVDHLTTAGCAGQVEHRVRTGEPGR